MIQRIQSVYLILSAICSGMSLLLPFAVYSQDGGDLIFDAFSITGNTIGVKLSFPHYTLLVFSMCLALLTVFRYKNRKQQLILGKLLYLVILASAILIFLDFDWIAQSLNLEKGEYSFKIGILIPALSLPFVFLANRGIKNDEKLVKSLDRLR